MYRRINKIRNKMKTGAVPSRLIVVVAAAATLAGCGGGGGGGNAPSNRAADINSGALYYSYPQDNQTGVAPRAPVVLNFANKISASASNFHIVDSNNNPVSFTMATVDDGKGVVLTPDQPLAVNTHYKVITNGIQTSSGELQFPDGAIDFTTRTGRQGAISSQETSSTFQVNSIFPDDQQFKTMDFSTFRLTTSQPIDTTTAVYGDTVKLMHDGQLVPALLLTKHNKITVDPVNDMTPGQQYDLVINGLKSTFGNTIAAYDHRVTPLNTKSPEGTRSTLVTKVPPASPDDNVGCLDPGVTLSPLTGMPQNCVPVVGTLLAHQTSSKLSGNVFAQLAYVVNFPQVTPLRIKKGSIFTGNALQVLIGGKVPVGFDSGKVHIQLISDATGYLYPNPNSSSPNAPKSIVLYMDVAANAADARANGAFTQNILHVKLVGQASLQNGSLTADAVAVMEPKVLGVDSSYGVLSFHMASYVDQTTAPKPPVDTENPHLLQITDNNGTHLSWQPGEVADRMVPGEPIVMMFNEALDKRSIKAGTDLMLKKNGAEVPFTWRLDGNALIITPNDPVAYGVPYQVSTTPDITDLAGNPLEVLNTLNGTNTLQFTLPDYIRQDGSGNSVVRGPWVMTTYPGFPCASSDPTASELANNTQGICLSAYPKSQQVAPDELPITTLPANRSIKVRFSQNMDPSSITLGTSCGSGSFRVETVDASGGCTGVVPGQLRVGTRSLTFMPDQPWQDGKMYRYTLASQSSGCGTGVICSTDNLPLQTALLEGPALTDGGPDMSILFKGGPASHTVFEELSNLPSVDVNNNLQVDSGEPRVPFGTVDPAVPANATQIFTLGSGGGGLVAAANTGCGFNGLPPYTESDKTVCPAKKMLYVAGDLNAEILNYDDAHQGVPLQIYPTEVTLTNLDATAVIGLNLNTSSGDSTLSIIPLVGSLLNGTVNTLGGVLNTLGLDTSQITVLNNGIGLIPINTSTGPNVIRVRYAKDTNGNRTIPPVGYIVSTPSGPQIQLTFDMLFDAPDLSLPLGLQHNVKSLPIDGVQLAGPLDFLPDGRPFIDLTSRKALNVDLNITLAGQGVGTVHLTIPAGAIHLSYQGVSIKKADLHLNP